jgi:D-glucuronyl C5-epimerase-like protein
VEGFSRVGVAAVCAAALVLAPAAGASSQSSLDVVKRGLARAVARGWLDPADAKADGAIAYRATRAIPRLRDPQAHNLAAVLGEVAAMAKVYTAPRALALFSMLRLNTFYLSRHPMPGSGRDVIDAEDGVLYRSFPGRGLQFHPLGNFARLGNLVLSGRDADAAELAESLVDRGVPNGPALTWEYYFPFDGGRAPWTSGMAQAVAASALARTDYLPEARRAYLALPRGLLIWLKSGPWVRLYRFSTAEVLNAQLQASISLSIYGKLSQDAEAAGLGDRLAATALALLPRFDTGSWSLYSLGGAEAPLNYHRYVVSLLKTLAQRTEDPAWTSWYQRFNRYLTVPPEIDAKRPLPAVGSRRPARISFWLSKSSRVTLSVGGSALQVWLARGYHTLLWSPGRRRAGAYAASLSAVDQAGNRAWVRLAPVIVRRG